ncbi:MAG: hypothetical protein IIC08_04665 [Proteobacteria bacterium]|nr:hypothetical protein [Pseudomonadota bacterium]
MPKVDDTNTIPENLTAPWLKRFFKRKLGIPVRVQNAGSSGWVQVWIMSDQSVDHRHGLTYQHHFLPELGNRCMRITYAGSEKLCEQAWGGNIQQHSIVLSRDQLRELLQGILERPIEK